MRYGPKWIKSGTGSMSRRQAYIYGVSGSDGPIKVGFSTNLHLRLQTLRFAFSRELEVMFYVPVDVEQVREIEKLAHFILRDRRVKGEWFDINADEALAAVQSAIERYSQGERVLRARDDPERKPQTVSLMLPRSTLHRITEWRARQKRIPSVSAAIRHLLEEGLAAEEARTRRLTPETNSGDIRHSAGSHVASRKSLEGSRPRQ
jgi:Arc/MetJ-type ribon-helix-helix transcriptional regulator